MPPIPSTPMLLRLDKENEAIRGLFKKHRHTPGGGKLTPMLTTPLKAHGEQVADAPVAIQPPEVRQSASKASSARKPKEPFEKISLRLRDPATALPPSPAAPHQELPAAPDLPELELLLSLEELQPSLEQPASTKRTPLSQRPQSQTAWAEELPRQLSSLQLQSPAKAESSQPISLVDPVELDAAWLLRRAEEKLRARRILGVPNELASISTDLFEVLRCVADTQEWLRLHETAERQLETRPARVVRFSSFDGSHLEPPAWAEPMRAPTKDDGTSDDPPRLALLRRLHGCVELQTRWLDSVKCGGKLADSAASAVLKQLRLVLGTALTDALAHSAAADSKAAGPAATSVTAPLPDEQRLSGAQRGSSTKRLEACGAFLLAELEELEQGRPMMRRVYSDILSSVARQLLRTIVDNSAERSAALLRHLPRGRGLGYLGKVTSAAKVLCSALYELHFFASIAHEPTIASLLSGTAADGREALAAMGQSDEYADLLSLAESRAALVYLLTHPLGPDEREPGWAVLTEVLEMAHATDAPQVHYLLPLRDLSALRAELQAPRSVNWLVSLAEWHSPQMPVQQRTRSYINPSRAIAA